MTPTSPLADQVRRVAQRAGLEAVGICDARPFTEARRVIEDRKRDGLAAGMQFTYRRPDRSTDPAVALPGARALVVGARGYLRRPPPDDETPADGGPAGKVARYSWVDHYQPLRMALGEVADHLVAAGFRARVLVDDNALVDRAAAVRAGLGWYGKNANVLLPGLGSWFVLGSVVTDAPLAGDGDPELVPDGCGSCRRCMVDCPTGAISVPGVIDGRKCLAWLVQAPGWFPVEHRVALGDRLYGCDACQERCPVNRRGAATSVAAVAEDGAQPYLAVLEILRSTDAELERMVGRWYIPGRQMRYVRRNALVVLGNSGDAADRSVVAALESALGHEDPLLRGHAAWAAGRLGLVSLLQVAVSDPDPDVRSEAGAALAACT